VNVDSGSGCENGPIIHTVTSRFVASIPGQMYTPSTGNEHMGMYSADLDKGVLVNSKVHELGNPKKKTYSLSNLCALEIDVQIFIRRPYDLADLTEGLSWSVNHQSQKSREI
jgi:hypothetical protein